MPAPARWGPTGVTAGSGERPSRSSVWPQTACLSEAAHSLFRGLHISTEVLALIGLGAAVVFATAAILYARRSVAEAHLQHASEIEQLRQTNSTAEQERKAIILTAKEEAFKLRAEVDVEVRERRSEMLRQEQRATQREESLERRRREVETGEQKLIRREAEIKVLAETVEHERTTVTTELQRVASLSQQDARAELLSEVEAELTSDIAERIRAAEAEVHEEAGSRGRDILIGAMQRLASDQTGEASVTVMQLPSDDLKGRIIGREGRNIRALEAATGVDVIVDDTPEAIVLSGFDPVRREIARVALERLVTDGRIHPARIEEVVTKSRNEVGQRIKEEGEQAAREIGMPGIHPELAKLLGTLRFRSTYGHNVLAHSKETAAIAAMLAAEIGYDEQEAREIALFHDIGHAASHEIGGSHALVGGEILARLGRPAAIVHAVRAHHYDEEPQTIGAFVLMTADSISASRRGARRESLDTAIKRLERLEAIANGFEGVERSFAIQAGKEIRVMVRPSEIDDDGAMVLARHIARRLHGEGTYTGRIKVVVLRETRSVEYAK